MRQNLDMLDNWYNDLSAIPIYRFILSCPKKPKCRKMLEKAHSNNNANMILIALYLVFAWSVPKYHLIKNKCLKNTVCCLILKTSHLTRNVINIKSGFQNVWTSYRYKIISIENWEYIPQASWFYRISWKFVNPRIRAFIISCIN